MANSKTKRVLNALNDMEYELCNAIVSVNDLKSALSKNSRPIASIAAQRLKDDLDRLQYGDSETWPDINTAFFSEE